METDSKQEAPDVIRSVRWSGEEWDLLGRAAAILGDREHITLSPTDIIRSGALRRAEEITAQ